MVQAWHEGDTDSLHEFCHAILRAIPNLPDIPEPIDPEERRRIDEEYGGVKGMLDELAAVARRLLHREKAKADEAAGIVRRPRPTMRVRSVNRLIESKPMLDPAAPRQERIGRRREPPVSSGAPPENGMTHHGVVVRFDQRSMLGTILEVGSGAEIEIAPGAVQWAQLTNLFPQQWVQFRIESGPGGRKAETIRLM
jgi:cold shock CspA family protein